MAKGRKTTQEERGKIVAFCIEHGKDYPLTIQTYGVSYQQIYAWVRKYEEKGIDGLRAVSYTHLTLPTTPYV